MQVGPCKHSNTTVCAFAAWSRLPSEHLVPSFTDRCHRPWGGTTVKVSFLKQEHIISLGLDPFLDLRPPLGNIGRPDRKRPGALTAQLIYDVFHSQGEDLKPRSGLFTDLVEQLERYPALQSILIVFDPFLFRQLNKERLLILRDTRMVDQHLPEPLPQSKPAANLSEQHMLREKVGWRSLGTDPRLSPRDTRGLGKRGRT